MAEALGRHCHLQQVGEQGFSGFRGRLEQQDQGHSVEALSG